MGLTIAIISLVGVLINAYVTIKQKKGSAERAEAVSKVVPGFTDALKEVQDAARKMK
jgi:hypothetical protein